MAKFFPLLSFFSTSSFIPTLLNYQMIISVTNIIQEHMAASFILSYWKKS